jgi:hypothetical protein
MKLDKETFQKHRFWFLTGGVVPLVLIGLIWLTTAVAADNRKQREITNQIRSKLAERSDPSKFQATREEEEALKKKEEKLFAQRRKVWEAAWQIQSELMTWPDSLQKDLSKLYFGDPLSEDPSKDEQLRIRFANDKLGYRTQLEKIVKLVEPTEFAGGWDKVVQHVKRWRREEVGPPSVEEVWLAQEDLWVQRELFLAIREANNSVGQMVRVTEEKERAPLPQANKGERFRERFRNPYWQLDLTLADSGGKPVLRGTIKNVGPRRQAIKQLAFKVYYNESRTDPEEFVIQGGLVAVGEELPLRFRIAGEKDLRNEQPVGRVADLTGLTGVDQVLDGASVPVKRIMKISIPYHSHRTYEPLQPPRFSKVVPPKKDPDAVLTEEEKKAPPLPSSKTENGLERLRYYDVTEQVRRIPVGIVMLVDQAHVQDVLTALASSKRPGSILRLQPTQVDWHRSREEFRPMVAEPPPKKDKEKEEPPPEGFPDPSKKEGPPPAAQQFTLVELAFYGIASLYERYPPSPKSTVAKEEGKEKE